LPNPDDTGITSSGSLEAKGVQSQSLGTAIPLPDRSAAGRGSGSNYVAASPDYLRELSGPSMYRH
jgi:hypothetical protein